MEMLPIQMIPVTPVGNSIGSAGSLQTALGLKSGLPAGPGPEIANFQQALSGALQQTNQYALQADTMVKKLAAGEVTDLHQVMIAVEKAGLSLQMTMQVRNKMVEAYQEIMRMQI